MSRLGKTPRKGKDEKLARKLGTRAKDIFVCEARLDCGCCDTGPMTFKNRASAERAFARCATQMGATVKDDTGKMFEGIDGFYGFWEVGEDPHGIYWLAKKAGIVR